MENTVQNTYKFYSNKYFGPDSRRIVTQMEPGLWIRIKICKDPQTISLPDPDPGGNNLGKNRKNMLLKF